MYITGGLQKRCNFTSAFRLVVKFKDANAYASQLKLY